MGSCGVMGKITHTRAVFWTNIDTWWCKCTCPKQIHWECLLLANRKKKELLSSHFYSTLSHLKLYILSLFSKPAFKQPWERKFTDRRNAKRYLVGLVMWLLRSAAVYPGGKTHSSIKIPPQEAKAPMPTAAWEWKHKRDTAPTRQNRKPPLRAWRTQLPVSQSVSHSEDSNCIFDILHLHDNENRPVHLLNAPRVGLEMWGVGLRSARRRVGTKQFTLTASGRTKSPVYCRAT